MKIQSSSSRWLIGLGLLVLALIVVSVVVATLNRNRQATLFPEDTPEGTVQRYLLAIDEDDGEAAYSYLSSELQEDCTYQHFRNSTQRYKAQDMRVTLEGTEPLNGRVEVRVEITQVHVNPPFGSSESSYPAYYILEQEDEGWRFAEPPWPMNYCPGLERGIKPERPLPVPAAQ